MGDKGEAAPGRSPTHVLRLSKGQRRAFTGLGVATFAAGVVAVFVASNDIGAVTLVLVGLVLILSGLLGLVPVRLRYKDAEVRLADFAEEAVEVAEEAKTQAGSRAAEAIVEGAARVLPPEYAKAVRARYAASTRYEEDVVEALRRVLSADDRLAVNVRLPKSQFNWVVDAIVMRGTRRVFVEIRLIRPGVNMPRRLLEIVERTRAIGGAWLVVTDVSLARFGESDLVLSARWQSRDDDKSLREALEIALAAAAEDSDSAPG